MQMQDKQIGVWFASATVLWGFAVLLITAGGIVGLASNGDGNEVATVSMVIGLWVTGAAMTLSIKHMFCRYNRLIRDAFEMGRDAERGERSLHSLR